MPVYNRFYLVNQKIDARALERGGALIPVEVRVPPAIGAILIRQGKAPQTPVTGMALVDSGASITAVDAKTLAELVIPPVGVTKVHTPSGEDFQNIYPVEIGFPGTNLPAINFTRVLGSKLINQGIIALIGRDVLKHFVVIFNGPGGFISLAY